MSTRNPRNYRGGELPNGARQIGPNNLPASLYTYAITRQTPNQTVLDQLIAREELAAQETSINLAAIPDSMLSGQHHYAETDDTYHPSKLSHVNRRKLSH